MVIIEIKKNVIRANLLLTVFLNFQTRYPNDTEGFRFLNLRRNPKYPGNRYWNPEHIFDLGFDEIQTTSIGRSLSYPLRFY